MENQIIHTALIFIITAYLLHSVPPETIKQTIGIMVIGIGGVTVGLLVSQYLTNASIIEVLTLKETDVSFSFAIGVGYSFFFYGLLGFIVLVFGKLFNEKI